MLLLPLLLVACGKTPGGNDGKDGTPEDTAPPAPTPIAVTGGGEDVEIAGGVGDSQGEPSTIAVDDNTILAAWMESTGYTIYVKMVRSADGGQTWSAPAFVDKDRWGWQNDPAFALANGKVYFTWLAIESNNASKGSIYCVDSTDGGQTWSEKVKLSTDAQSVDRQWMASDPVTGKVVITWDSFEGNSEWQSYSESTTGCAGFSTPETITNGVFLNGIPAVDTEGNVWSSRNEFTSRSIKNIISKRTDKGWVDYTLQSYDYPTGSPFATGEEDGGTGASGDTGALPEEGDTDAGNPEAEGEHGPYQAHEPFQVNLSRLHIATLLGLDPLKDNAVGTYDGEYSPVLMANPNGGLDIVTLATEEGDPDYGDVNYFHFANDDVQSQTVLNRDDGSQGQMEPWIAVDVAGGIHTIWYDGREGQWRLYGATSLDGGATWNEYTVGDQLFTYGFDETQSRYNSWVGHFQGLTTTSDHVITVFGVDNRDDHSFMYCDRAPG